MSNIDETVIYELMGAMQELRLEIVKLAEDIRALKRVVEESSFKS